MTTYVLAGGDDFKRPDYGNRLAAELKKSLKSFRILSCFFSSPRETWPTGHKKWQTWFEQNVGNIAEYDYATPENIVEKSKNFDILYFHGGDNDLLLKAVDGIKDLRSVFKDHIVVGSSAGANMISRNFWSSTHRKAGKGLAILPISIMVHYGAAQHNGTHRTKKEWEDEEAMFRKFISAKEEILHLPEGEFKVFKVDK